MQFSIHNIRQGLLEAQPSAYALSEYARRESDEGRLVPRPSEGEEVLQLASHSFSTAGVAHDLGNLLQVIASAVGLIDRQLDDESRPNVQPFTRSALAAVERAGLLTRQLLDTSSPAAGRHPRICPNETLQAIHDLVSLTAGPAIELRTICNGDVPAIRCDARELENVILNLVINARDAMPHGGRLILSTHSEFDASKGRRGAPSAAVISVCDSGSGMPADVASKVFTPFYSTKPQGKGTGLGLALVDDFARRCGGSAELETAVGVGTTVILRLPASIR